MKLRQDSTIDLLYLAARGQGWGPVDSLVRLSTRLLGANLIVIRDPGEASLPKRLSAYIPRTRRRGRTLIVIAANPAILAHASRLAHWIPGYEKTAAWIIDSFWTERIARFARTAKHFDAFFITDPYLSGVWESLTNVGTTVLPWGADTLDTPDRGGHRTTDFLRLGRQPPAWDNDEETQRAAESIGLKFSGRPAFSSNPHQNKKNIFDALLDAKFVLAFNNITNPTCYTHPSRDYVTARWTDALAAGATVIGTAPSTASILFWPGATKDIAHDSLNDGIQTVASLVEKWTPRDAVHNQRMARETLDWRYRLATMCRALELPIPLQLTHELSSLANKVARSA